MKRTVSVNIKGMNFLVEEDAYELLQNYLDRLNHVLRNESGRKEIIEDIELRVAELCSAELSEKKQVIEIEDIETILKTLGDPSQFVDEDETSHESANTSNAYDSKSAKNERRLFRDVDNATIAGVCSGIANFFNIDVVIIRAIFVVMFLFGGFGIPLYIILWIIVPKANSSIDRLRMRGKAITVESVREEVELAANRLTKESKSFSDKLRSEDGYTRRLSSLGRFIRVSVGIFLCLFGLFHLTIFLIFLAGGVQFIPVQSDTGFLSFAEFGDLFLTNSSDYNLGMFGIILASISAILFILLLGTKLIFRITNKWSKLALGFLFSTAFIGGILCLIVGIHTGRDMTIEGEIERKLGSVHAQQIEIVTHNSTFKRMEEYEVKSNGNFGMIGIEGNKILSTGVHIEYKLSKDSLFHVSQNLSAHSHSHKTALNKAKNIKHTATMIDSTLHLNSFFKYPKTDKLRDQQVYIIIEIPKGKSVLVNNEIIMLGSDEDEDDEEEVNEYYKEYGMLSNDGEYEHW